MYQNKKWLSLENSSCNVLSQISSVNVEKDVFIEIETVPSIGDLIEQRHSRNAKSISRGLNLAVVRVRLSSFEPIKNCLRHTGLKKKCENGKGIAKDPILIYKLLTTELVFF